MARRVARPSAAWPTSKRPWPTGADVGQDEHVYEEYALVDGAGRLQIPPDMRAEIGIRQRVTLEAADGCVVIRPVDGGQDYATASEARQADDQPMPAARDTGLSSLWPWLRSRKRS